MGTGQVFKSQDLTLIAAKFIQMLNEQDGQLFLGKRPLNITLPGEKGDPGKTPVKGVDYDDGEDGMPGQPPKHQWDGTKIRFEKPDGKWGVWVDLKGKEGDPGKTPEKDIDYRDGIDGDDGIGRPPAHEWKGTKIRFQNPDKSWGQWVDLKGAKGDKEIGPKGDIPAHEWRGPLIRFQNPDGSWDKWTDLRGPAGKGLKGDPGDKPVAGIDYKIPKDGKDAELPEALDMTVLIDADLVLNDVGAFLDMTVLIDADLVLNDVGAFELKKKYAQIRIYPKG
jgi:hypothetical protein